MQLLKEVYRRKAEELYIKQHSFDTTCGRALLANFYFRHKRYNMALDVVGQLVETLNKKVRKEMCTTGTYTIFHGHVQSCNTNQSWSFLEEKMI